MGFRLVWVAGHREILVAKIVDLCEDGSVRHIVRDLRTILLEGVIRTTDRVRVVAIGATFGERCVRINDWCGHREE